MNKPVALLLAALCPIALASACSSKDATQDPGKADCDNLDTTACMFPFPSDFFRKTGGPYGHAFQLDFGKNLPINAQTDLQIDGSAFADHDGFPIYPQVAFSVPGATLEGAPNHSDIDGSLKPDAKVLLLDADSGELQPHWVEFEYLSAEGGAKVIELRLAKVLKHSHRYIVAVRNLVDAQGKPADATPGFRALRDKSSTALLGIEGRRARFESEIFPALEKIGVKRSDLQLAWDFTTTSEEAATSRIRGMRDELYARIGEEGPDYTITESQKNPDGPDGYIDTILTGVAKVPSFMLPAEPSKPRKLRLNDKGLAVVDGFEDVIFHVQIPKITRTSATKAGVVQYGHGFLGDDGEANNDWLRKYANDRNFLILSSNMQGMDSSAGILWFIALPRDMSNFARLGDEPLQGIMNHLALERLLKGRFTKDPTMQKGPEPIYNPDQLYYTGNSQGGTQGFVVTAMSRDIKRSCLGEPGISIAYILARARNWHDLVGAIQTKYPNPYDLASIQALVSVGWDKGDGTNIAQYNSMTPPADGTPKSLLLHVGIEDAQVNNDVTHLLARSIDATILAPKSRAVWGLTETPGPITTRNAMVEFDYGVPIHANSNEPAKADTDTHDKPKKSVIAQEQMWHFFQTGEIINTCSDTCNPE